MKKMSTKSALNDNFVFDPDAMVGGAQAATDFLKAVAHEGRLMILCRLAEGECSVTEFEELLSARQAAVSQQLARLRLDGVVGTRRDGKSVYYFLQDERVKKFIPILYEMFCKDDH
jgi:DNA-binding transcriptional ArsR family regulator